MVRYPSSASSSSSSNTAMSNASQINALNPQGSYNDLMLDLHALHADEFAYLSENLTGFEKRCEESWVLRSLAMIKQYVLFVVQTWLKAFWAFLFFPTTLMDRISIAVLSAAACAIMTVLLPWCLLCNVPFVGELFDHYSKKLCNGLSIVNASYPTIFEELSDDQIAAAKRHLSQPVKHTRNSTSRRVFNLDAGKLLLQCAALMYERSSRSTLRAATTVFHRSKRPSQPISEWSPDQEPHPGSHIASICGVEGAEAVMADLHSDNDEENTIRRIANDKLGLQYSTVSDLNSIGSAFCGLFWDPENTFIIVSFRGTTPTDYTQWITDFTFQMRDAGQWLRGFGRVHQGFMNKIFPPRVTPGSRLPYATINEAIRRVAEQLHEHSPEKPINVWTTGHSLGCALASLVYARQILEPVELGEHVDIRDAYLFAAPVVCDVESANAFNNRINHLHDHMRTMWRVTNGRDAVATSLPDEGDNTELSFSPWNLFSFSHLGCEVKLRNAPQRCRVKGSLVTPGTHVLIESEFHLDALEDEKPALRHTLLWLQDLPLVGRLLAHGTGFYWASLQAVGSGSCEWIYG